MTIGAASGDLAAVLVEIGAITLGLAVVARVSDRFGLSPIPAYLVAGLAFGNGGFTAPDLSTDFLTVAAEIGVLLLLLTLGLEYGARELADGLRTGAVTGVVDVVANATPGFLAALILGWDIRAAVLLGGITYISSSGVIAKVLGDLGRLGNRETPTIISVLVLEDLAMAVYLPCVAVMLAGGGLLSGSISVTVALATAGIVFFVALRYGRHISRALDAPTDEALLLGVLGLTLVVAGIAQRLDVSAAVGAFLVGIAISGPVQRRASVLIDPLRDLFAAIFFVLFAFRIDPGTLPPVLLAATALAVVTGLTKFGTGWWAARRQGYGPRARMRVGTALVARGEFSIVIAGLAIGTTVEPDLVPLTAAYVLILAVAGPVLTRFADRLTPARTRRG
ncbi:MAG: cation:proton antiporter [Actinomycetota bacterium]